MDNRSKPNDRPKNWSRWLGYALLAVVIALAAKPIWAFVELLCFLNQMGNMNG